MNNIDRQYKELLEHILHFGVEKKDRTGTGTKSLFGWQIRHRMEEGFPLLTTKKMAWKSIVTELLWFLRGDTNIKYLVDNGCHIWDGDAYKNYLKWFDEQSKFFKEQGIVRDPWTKEQYVEQIKLGNVDADLSELGPIYGKQWRKWTKKKMYFSTDGSYENIYDEADQTVIDQISCLINELKTNPDSRRLMVNAWNVGDLDQMVLPPCHYSWQVYTRELTASERITYKNTKQINLLDSNELFDFIKSNVTMDLDDEVHKVCDESNVPRRAISLMWNQRSVDTFLGLPFNIASYGLLLEIIAKAVNMVPEDLIGNLGDVHLYSNHIEQAKEQLTRSAYDLPNLVINKTDEFWKGFDVSLFNHLDTTDFTIENYQSHSAIKAPLSN
jgi:thymidylate synthase